MRYFHQIGSQVEILPLMTAIVRQPELWDANTLRTTYPDTPHREASDIWLRFNEITENVVDDTECIDYPAFAVLPQARALIFNLMRFVEGKRLGRVLITKLKPGTQIYPHKDEGAPATYYQRYHIALQCLPGCKFNAGNESVNMMTGDVYWFDNTAEHSVVNNSADDRVVMIVDIQC